MKAHQLSHLNDAGEARMVDIGGKSETVREAVACARISLEPETLRAIEEHTLDKGDVYAAARIAGIMAAKRTPELIPMCHPLQLNHVAIVLEGCQHDDRAQITITATVRNQGRTGVEMEALVAASIAALTVYDMCKSIDRAMVVTDTFVKEKRGGKSGPFVHPGTGGGSE